MQNTRFDKSKLPSRHVTVGPSRAPHRSYFYAMGITEEEINNPGWAWLPAGTKRPLATSRLIVRCRL